MDPREEAHTDRTPDRIGAPPRERSAASDGPADARAPIADTRTPITEAEHGGIVDPNAAKAVGKGTGGMLGMATGGAIGAIAGPIGILVGVIAGAVGGWWAGDAIAQSMDKYTESDDRYFRSHYDALPRPVAGRSFEDLRPAYQLGLLAAHNPDYQGRPFELVEPELRRGWSPQLHADHGEWREVRDSVRTAYLRGGGE